MCVSAEASFTLSSILSPIGLYCVANSIRKARTLTALAMIPLIFGIQQFVEGLVWLAIKHGDTPRARSAAVAYLFFALCFWLIWIPFSVWLTESDRNTRRLLMCLLMIGLIGGGGLFLPIALDPTRLEVSATEGVLAYEFPIPSLIAKSQPMIHLIYLAVITLPLMIASRKRKELMAFSILLVASAIVSHLYYWYAFASIWCFFAAAISLTLVMLFHNLADDAMGQEPLIESGSTD